ncbi:MAG TPA: hypothetical protein VFK62_06965 [Gaiellaceae bacterium]|nr:hypothetical protein [Gaiellaceae bacterium]
MKTLAIALVLGAALATAASAAAPTLTLTSSATVVAYGKPLTLSGQLTGGKPSQTVTVDGTVCGTSRATKVASVKTTASGAYSAAVTPTGGTTYQATYKNVKSAGVSVTVKPVLALSKSGATWTAKVTAGQALTGKAVLFQRYVKKTKRWKQVKRVLLTVSAAGATKPTTISSATFTAKLARGTRVRLLITTAQAAPCYVTAASPSLRA